MDSLSLLLKGKDLEDISIDMFNELSHSLSYLKSQGQSNITKEIIFKLDNCQLLPQLNETTTKATNFVSCILGEKMPPVVIALIDILTRLINFYDSNSSYTSTSLNDALAIIDKSLNKSLKIIDNSSELLLKKAIDFVSDLVAATKGLPLKILAFSCFGANLQNCLPLLPKGSMLITLSDVDVHTDGANFSHDKMQFMLETFASNVLKLEHLLEMGCIAQRFSQNTPIIGVVNRDGTTKTINLSALTEQSIRQSVEVEFSSSLEGIFLDQILSKSYSQQLIERVKIGATVDSFKIPKELLKLTTIVEHIKRGILPILKSEWQKYYEPEALDNLVFNTNNYDYQEKHQAKKLNKKQKLEIKMAHLQKLTKLFTIEEIGQEIGNMLRIMLNKSLTIHERELAEAHYKLLIKQSSATHKLHEIELLIAIFDPNQCVSLPNQHHYTQELQDPITQAMPNYNRLLVLGADYLVQHIGDIIDGNIEF